MACPLPFSSQPRRAKTRSFSARQPSSSERSQARKRNGVTHSRDAHRGPACRHSQLMSVVARLLVLAVAGGLTLALGAHSALAADPAKVSRPTTGGEYAYSRAEAAPYVGVRAVVHYVTTGSAAPPLNDDDGTGFPDYVEQV